ncbi:MAG: hypothetical protein QY304_02115 [Candidatus Paceibacterota bacterium]|nr:MAG: hypothetical protein QY304_02115 [Candidatus Paceibacterota bacterium]
MEKNYIKEIKDIFRNHDPVDLIRTGAPNDEYDPLVEKFIIPLLNKEDDKYELGEKLYTVFVDQFDENIAGDSKKYYKIAESILKLS